MPHHDEDSQTQSDDSRERINSSASEEDERARALSDWEGEGGASGAKKEAIGWAPPLLRALGVLRLLRRQRAFR